MQNVLPAIAPARLLTEGTNYSHNPARGISVVLLMDPRSEAGAGYGAGGSYKRSWKAFQSVEGVEKTRKPVRAARMEDLDFRPPLRWGINE